MVSSTETPGILTPDLLERLRSEAVLMDRAAETADDPFAAAKLRSALPDCPPDLAAAAVEQVRLRQRAAAKFARAGEMWFSPSLLEQASGSVVARYRAGRFAPWDRVGDLCCGLGGDTLALAERVQQVTAMDRDPLALALTRANAEALGVAGRVELRLAELPEGLPCVPVAWVDPGRREGGRRTRSPDRVSPPLAAILSFGARMEGLGIKLSPASGDEELDRAVDGIPHEREFLSVNGECRELVVWTGDLAGIADHRATLLPGGATLAGSPEPLPETGPPAEWLLEPDPAVIRAGLVGNLAAVLGARNLDPRLAFLSVDAPVATPFAVTYRITAVEPFSLRALSRRLRGLEAADVVIKTRGSAVRPELLRRELRAVLKQGRPGVCPVVFVTRLRGRPVALVGERFGAGADQ